jgi:hypothetical protein
MLKFQRRLEVVKEGKLLEEEKEKEKEGKQIKENELNRLVYIFINSKNVKRHMII